MVRRIFSKVLWLGRATSTVLGLAVILALIVGAATAPLGAAPALTFKLGQINTSNAVSSLVGAVSGSNLKIENTNTNPNAPATALELKVPQGKAPMRVNADAGTATNLDADKVDGKDASSFASTNSEAWHEVGAPGETQFHTPPQTSIIYGSWTRVGPVYNKVGFYKDSMGIVHLKGRLTVLNDASPYPFIETCPQQFFTLPAGYRPAAIEAHPALRSVPDSFGFQEEGESTQVRILPTGEVGMCDDKFIENDSEWVSLDGISFLAAN